MGLLSIFFLFSIGMAPESAEPIFATQDNSIYKNPADASWVESNGEILTIRHKYSASYSRKAWVQFDVSATPYNSQTAASFSITWLGLNFTPSAGDAIVVSGLQSGFVPPAGVLGTDWTETTVTWNNAPGNKVGDSWLLDANSTTELGRLDLTSTHLTAGQVLEFKIDTLADFVQSNGTVTLMLTLKSYGDGKACNFASTEHSTYAGPSLFVDNTSPSTPGNFDVNDISETSSWITWSASTDDTGIEQYKLYRDGVCIATTNATEIYDTGLSKYRSYEYTVEAYDTSGNISPVSEVVQYGYRRFPFFIPITGTAQGITDMSALTSTSAADAFVTASGGDLYANGEQIRFLGVNLAGQACFPTAAVADIFSAHLAKMGINCVRMHDIDRVEPYGLFDTVATSSPNYMVQIDAGQLDKFDYLVSSLKSAGIYVDLQLHKSRIYPNMPVGGTKKYFQGTDLYYPEMIALQQDFASDFLNHTNAYTGNAYKDEPAIAFIEINNEDGLIHEWARGLFSTNLNVVYRTELERQWHSWLSAAYTHTTTLQEAWLPAAGYAYGAEELVNGDFSAGTSAWTVQMVNPASGSHQVIANQAPDGLAALEISVANAGSAGWHVQAYQTGVHLVKDRPYTVTFWAKAEAARAVTAKLQAATTPYAVYGEAVDFQLSTDWEEYTFVIRPTQSDPNARISLTNLGLAAGKVWFAQASVQQGNTLLSSITADREYHSATEQMTNGSFTNGTSDWNIYISSPAAGTYGVESTAGPTNQAALKISITTADAVDPWRARCYQLVSSVTANQPYILSFWAKADAVRTLTAGLYSNGSPWNLSELKSVVIGTQWKQYSVVVCPDVSESNVRVNFTNLADQTGDLWLTGISLTTGIQGLKTGETLWSMGMFDLDEFATRTRSAQKDWMRFLWETETAYYTGMKDYVKNTIGAKGLVIGSQTYFSPALIQGEMDVVDTHFYLGHPANSGDPENWYFYNYSMAGRDGFNFPMRNAPLSVANKPFICTEYNHPNPGTYGGEAFLLAAAYASLQNWDAVFAFNYYSFASTTPSKYFHHYYSICQEPVKLVTFPAAAALLRRGDVERPASLWTVTLSVDDVIDKIIEHGREGVGADDFGFSALHALQFPIAIQKGNQTQFVNVMGAVPEVLTSEAEDLFWDSANGLVYIKSAKSKAIIGKAGQQTHALGDGVSVTTTATLQPGDWTAISLIVKEGSSFAAAGANLLITATGYTDNMHMIWKDGAGPEAFATSNGTSSVGSNWGKPSVLVEGIEATLTLNGLAAADVQVWALDENGVRATPLPVSQAGSAVVFTLDPSYRTPWYEVEIVE